MTAFTRTWVDGGRAGPYEGTCTARCAPTGALSIVGVWSGQCDCELMVADDPAVAPTCDVGESAAAAETCCGALDTAWGVVLYVLIVLYTFVGLAIICDGYFCEALAVIVEVLQLSGDVAGATFMAAGSSAPELFTAIVTTLITGGSEGLGAIVGSAVFNIMVIVGLTALAACGRPGDASAARRPLEPIWWYPLARDSLVYVVAIVLMVVFMALTSPS